MPVSEATKAKISAALKGRNVRGDGWAHTPEAKAKIAQAMVTRRAREKAARVAEAQLALRLRDERASLLLDRLQDLPKAVDPFARTTVKVLHRKDLLVKSETT